MRTGDNLIVRTGGRFAAQGTRSRERPLNDLHASKPARKKIEVFSAGCPLCRQAIDLVRRQAGSSCEIIVHNMMDARGFARATALGVRAVPAVAIDGKLVSSGRGIDIQMLRDAGLRRPLH